MKIWIVEGTPIANINPLIFKSNLNPKSRLAGTPAAKYEKIEHMPIIFYLFIIFT